MPHRRKSSLASALKRSFPRSSLNQIPFSYASVSVGTPNDPLEQKLAAISSAGFVAIELGFPDLQSFASKHLKKDVKENDYLSLCEAGKEVKALCERYKLSIMMLQPFSNFEGWAKGSKERQNAFARARGWIEIMQAVGTDMLQVGSSDSPNISSSHDVLAADLAELADLLAKYNFRLAYENWCWATHAPTWSDVYSIIQKVNRPNIGLCLDTFQTVCGEYGDPSTGSCLVEDKGMQQKLEMNLKASLLSLTNTVPPEKIFVLQLSDAYRPPSPFLPDGPNLEANETGPDGEKVRARAKWSHDYRPYFWNGGYFTTQCVDMCKAVLGTKFRGWFSVEVFDTQNREPDMKKYCEGAMDSCKKLIEECSDGS